MEKRVEDKNLIEERLTKRLEELKASSVKKIPAEFLKEMQEATAKLKEEHFGNKTIKVGETFPDAKLLTAQNEEINLKDSLGKGPVIISFYRGSWCPYCNLELNYYNELLKKPENKSVRVLAISPERPDTSIDVSGMKVEVLSDIDNKLAKQLKLVFTLPTTIQEIYQNFGIDLDKSQGNSNKELPIPATFIVDKKGLVTYLQLDEDYTTRPDADEIIKHFKKLV